jgi:hypothetical protein
VKTATEKKAKISRGVDDKAKKPFVKPAVIAQGLNVAISNICTRADAKVSSIRLNTERIDTYGDWPRRFANSQSSPVMRDVTYPS